jgi:hypothetical protein
MPEGNYNNANHRYWWNYFEKMPSVTNVPPKKTGQNPAQDGINEIVLVETHDSGKKDTDIECHDETDLKIKQYSGQK